MKSAPNINKARTDYHPFGMVMPGRNWEVGSGEDYGLGYQGSLLDAEIYGNANSYSTFFRELDPRLMRWWSTDAKTRQTPWESPYVSMGNNPIWFNDVLGDEIFAKTGLFGKKVKYNENDGKFYDKKGNEYTGKSKFIKIVGEELNKTNSTSQGHEVLSALSSASEDFTFKNRKSSSGSAQFSGNANDKGGVINAKYLMNNNDPDNAQTEVVAHELFHGYQSLNGSGGASINSEVEAYIFGQSVIQKVYNIDINQFPIGAYVDTNFENAFRTLSTAPTFNQEAFNVAVATFKNSVFNLKGTYDAFLIVPNYKTTIDKLYPLK